ncbi:MAG: hypothetical protein HLX50_01485 [Alteromonadaceae bacterium]|nr:hypothetical protein [Alteromonadaceae bacterium]
METANIPSRYVTADFRSKPAVALAELMGLKGHELVLVENAPDTYSPILSGIASHRHLPRLEAIDVNRKITHLTNVPIRDRLLGLIALQRVQKYWFMWSLSDEELWSFFQSSKLTEEITDQFNNIAVPTSITAGGVASAIYQVSQHGVKGAAPETAKGLLDSPATKRVAKILTKNAEATRMISGSAVACLLVITVLNAVASRQASTAKRELAARGLLTYNQL